MSRRMTLLAGLVLLLLRTTAAGAQSNIPANGSQAAVGPDGSLLVLTRQTIPFDWVAPLGNGLLGHFFGVVDMRTLVMGIVTAQGEGVLTTEMEWSIHKGEHAAGGIDDYHPAGNGVHRFSFAAQGVPPFQVSLLDTIRFVAHGRAVPKRIELPVQIQATVYGNGTVTILVRPPCAQCP